MAEELVEKCSKLHIIPEEDDIVDLGDGFEEKQDEKLSLRLVGRVLTDKPLNFEAVKRTFLLAKQSWRLLMGTNPLLLEVFKARYFKHSSVLEANRGYDPSYTWRSIWGAKSVLLEGLSWRVGNWVNIRVCHDKWVPRGGEMTTPISVDAPHANMSVSELIDFDNAAWDCSILSRLFDSATMANILMIPLSRQWPNDNLFWFPNKNGIYSVKSGYWLGLLGHRGADSNPAAADFEKLWRIVWNVMGPPKLKHFLWRLCKGSLASKAVLYNRFCVPSPVCDRCGGSNETLLHALVDCPNSYPMWVQHSAFNTINDAPRSSASDFILWVHGHTSSDDFLSICATLWAAWFFRNKQVFQNESGDPVRVATDFNRLVADYNCYSEKVLCHYPIHILQFTSWCPPISGWVKINFDAHVNNGVDRGLGVVCRDDRGKLLLAAVRRLKCNWEVDVCEAAAALFGVELALRFGYNNIQLEGDSMTVISAIENNVVGLSPIHLIFDHIVSLSSSLSGFGCSHVKRAGNTLAHLVARWDTGIADEKLCLDPFPQGLQTLAELDLS